MKKIINVLITFVLLSLIVPPSNVQAQKVETISDVSTNYPQFDVYFVTNGTTHDAVGVDYGEFVQFGNNGTSLDRYSIPEDFPFINLFPAYTEALDIRIKRSSDVGLSANFTHFVKDFRDTTDYTFVIELGANVSTINIEQNVGTLAGAAKVVSIYTDSTDKDNTIVWETLNGSLSSRSPIGTTLTSFNTSTRTENYIVVELKSFKEARGLTALYTTGEANAAAGGNADSNNDGIDDTGKGVTYEAGWNMVSIPISNATTTNNTPLTIFGTDVLLSDDFLSAFEYSPIDNIYNTTTELQAGRGYWIYASAITDKITRYFGDVDLSTYEPVFTTTTPTIPADRYVMIGGTATPTPLDTTGIDTDAIWTWNNGGYRNASDIEIFNGKYIIRPGKGYWVSGTGATATLNADIFLQQSTTEGVGASFAPKKRFDMGDRITITHGDNLNIQDLFIGADRSISTPPFPPKSFQATLSGVNLISEKLSDVIQIREATEDIVLEFDPVNQDDILKVEFDNELYYLGKGATIGISARGNFDINIKVISKEQEDLDKTLPTTIGLAQNYPNPFNPITNISYTLPQTVKVQLDVYNMNGQKISTLVNSTQSAGLYNVSFDATNLPTGVYIYRLITPTNVITRKMTLIK